MNGTGAKTDTPIPTGKTRLADQAPFVKVDTTLSVPLVWSQMEIVVPTGVLCAKTSAKVLLPFSNGLQNRLFPSLKTIGKYP